MPSDLGSADTNSSCTYVALSYVWEALPGQATIICNDGPVQVTANLGLALQQIWSANPRLCTWADALCINQDDLDEKPEQVSIMSHIFCTASAVHIWLGFEFPSGRTALDVLVAAHTKGQVEMQRAPGLGLSDSELDDVQAALLEVAASTWFQRDSLPEFLLAARVTSRCGRDKAESSSLQLASRMSLASIPP